MKPARPADVTVVLAAAKAHNYSGWTGAAGVAAYLRKLGFPTSVWQASAYLRQLTKLECPPVVARFDAAPWVEYRVTGFGALWISNTLGVRLEGEFPHPSEIAGGETR